MVVPSFSITQVPISEEGEFIIPEHIRERYGIEDGSTITFVKIGNCIHILPAIPEEALRRWQEAEGDEAVRVAQELVETYRWKVVNP
jgi:bifunctional DNA-binding transcriptional regulator/antitoxin component of YhaV-PrlF toxin-antitoxin module